MLQVAAKYGQWSIFQWLVEREHWAAAVCRYNSETDDKGNTLLHQLAASGKHIELIQALRRKALGAEALNL
eukprot:1793038-Amphidinium_carterae.1